MQRISVFIIAALLIFTSLPCFVTKAYAAQKEKNIFRIIYDSIEQADQARQKKTWEDPIQKTYPIFKQLQSWLNSLDEKSARAKKLSLRTNKAEVLKRRNIK